MARQNISEQENIGRATRRTAMLYRHFAETLQNELGAEKAHELILKAIYAYGGQIGREARDKTLALGFKLTAENYQDDLPSVGWEKKEVVEDGEKRLLVSRCPLMKEWEGMDKALASLYCFVDQAKIQAYNPDLEYVHLSKLTEGDPCCTLVVREEKGGKGQ